MKTGRRVSQHVLTKAGVGYGYDTMTDTYVTDSKAQIQTREEAKDTLTKRNLLYD